jgi:hypothetical protein
MPCERYKASENPYEAPRTPHQRRRRTSPYWPIHLVSVLWVVAVVAILGLLVMILDGLTLP